MGEVKMMRNRDGYKLMSWWLPEDLVARLKKFQHGNEIDNTVDAARLLLDKGIAEWEQQRQSPPAES